MPLDSPAILAGYFRSRLLQWKDVDPHEYRKSLMQRVAYACRYGYQDANHVMNWGGEMLRDFNDAIESIIEMEAKAVSKGGKVGG